MFFFIPLLGIIFKAFYHVDCEGEASSIANSSLGSYSLFLMLVERTTETCLSEITIKELTVLGCCVYVDWIATVMYMCDTIVSFVVRLRHFYFGLN